MHANAAFVPAGACTRLPRHLALMGHTPELAAPPDLEPLVPLLFRGNVRVHGNKELRNTDEL